MSAHSLAQRPFLPTRSTHHHHRYWQDDFLLSLTAKMNADRQRIFQALTLPEYMEAWITLPGASRQALRVSTAEKCFRIDISEGSGRNASIYGDYLSRRRSKLHFTWTNGLSSDSPPSTVMVRLNGDFERTELVLIHGDLKSHAEYEWHRAFWQESLHKLSSLFLSTRSTPTLERRR